MPPGHKLLVYEEQTGIALEYRGKHLSLRDLARLPRQLALVKRLHLALAQSLSAADVDIAVGILLLLL